VRNPVEIDPGAECRKYIERPAIMGQAAIRTCLSYGMMHASERDSQSGAKLRLMTAPKQNTVLIVDDDGDVRELLSEFLEGNGFRVYCAENGEAALDEIRKHLQPPKVILLDLAMPVMDGYTFLSRARQDRRIKNVPIIVITADPPRTAPDATMVLAKPIKPEKILSLVQRLVP
jgi:two-component system response regulator CpxR